MAISSIQDGIIATLDVAAYIPVVSTITGLVRALANTIFAKYNRKHHNYYAESMNVEFINKGLNDAVPFARLLGFNFNTISTDQYDNDYSSLDDTRGIWI